ncbi:family 20 glycosylhydrolase [Desertivirga xinjiangensis]|uniref:family 20 glycosylhydrolase n=1 Tax=Desertivirga xinjiangensis TaxID=539206 RepID=UPI00210A8CB7|nr:family 20 glycosylhydrolase [Pedobacter xinjiangensis]
MQFLSFIRAQSSVVLTLLLSTLLNSNSIAQSNTPGYQNALIYSWEINTQKATRQPVLLLKNNGGINIPVTGWSLYFNSIKKPFSAGADSLKYHISHINGDRFRISVKPGLNSLKPGESFKINISVPDIRNFTEVPSGFYLVYDNEPGKGYLLKNTTSLDISIEPAVALASYKKNEQLNTLPAAEPSLIFPSPVSYIRQKGSFELTSKTIIVSPVKFRMEAELLASELAEVLGTKPVISTQRTSSPAIELALGDSPAGGYLLKSATKGITITASEASGIFYGIQSLKILLPPEAWATRKENISIPALEVSDAPRFGHRAFMLDVARNFQSKEKVLKVLDLMALYKMNVLHFHLTDDEGWRIEIPGLPELTEVGARRGHSADIYQMLPPAYGSGPDSNNRFGSGYFSRNDYLEILRYATARHICVIPEIESPGHARAAIKSMDARYHKYLSKGLKTEAEQFMLRDLSDSSVYRSVQGWTDNVINPALPSTYNFIRKVTNELVKMYVDANAPLKMIHMGGDEVPEGVWAKSPAVNSLLSRDTSIKTVYGMWKYYYGKVNDILKENNLHLYGWEEIGLKRMVLGGKKKWVLDPSVANRGYTTDVWNNIIGTGAEDLAYKLANAGFKVVLSNVTNMYLDMAYNNSFYEHGMNWAGFVNVDKPFYFIPYNYYLTTTENEYGEAVSQEFFKNKDALKQSAIKNIVGLQSALWTETIVQDSLLEYMLLPKLLGVAERAWAKEPAWSNLNGTIFTDHRYKTAWNKFTSTIGLRELPRLAFYKGGFSYRIPEPGVECLNGVVKANVQLPGFTIRYTTDGSEPTMNSPIYTSAIKDKGIITLKVFSRQGRSGKKVVVHN